MERGQKKQSKNKTKSLFHLRDGKKQKSLDLTKRGKSNDIAHRPIIRVFTVSQTRFAGGQAGLPIDFGCPVRPGKVKVKDA